VSGITLQIGEDRFVYIRPTDGGWDDRVGEDNVYAISVGTSSSIQRPYNLNSIHIQLDELDEFVLQLGRAKKLMVLA
jgi:hypothetical protein